MEGAWLMVKLTVLSSLISFGLTVASVHAAYTEKIHATPDYMQTDPAYGGFPSDEFCGPVSVSNSLMWLSDHGFPGLTNHTSDRKHDQYVLADRLGVEYMESTDGTSADELCRGLSAYLDDCGYTYQRLAYQGWRYVSPQFDSGVDIPELDWLRSGVEGLGCTWLHVGWYDFDAARGDYTRVGGHWLTLVGYGHDGQQENPLYLIAHDPAPRAGSSFANEYVLPAPISGGQLLGSEYGLPRSAAGYQKLTGGMHIKSTADFAILDGAVVLTMPEPATLIPLAMGILWFVKRPRARRDVEFFPCALNDWP